VGVLLKFALGELLHAEVGKSRFERHRTVVIVEKIRVFMIALIVLVNEEIKVVLREASVEGRERHGLFEFHHALTVVVKEELGCCFLH